jgi:hypothetical protein
MVVEALNGRPFAYHGETITGYCGLCNEWKDVTLRQLFACTACWAVLSSMQKALVASAAVHEIWRTEVQPEAPEFRLIETEVVRLEPFVRRSKTKRFAATTLDQLDFLVAERVGLAEHPRFHIELKSGPGSCDAASADRMTEFQLDVNDYEDVLGAVRHTELPAYILHVQVEVQFVPPTRRMRVAGAWWSDLERLRGKLKSVKQRRGADKNAAYFELDAFHPISTFVTEIRNRGYAQHQMSNDLSLPQAPWSLKRRRRSP